MITREDIARPAGPGDAVVTIIVRAGAGTSITSSPLSSHQMVRATSAMLNAFLKYLDTAGAPVPDALRESGEQLHHAAGVVSTTDLSFHGSAQ